MTTQRVTPPPTGDERATLLGFLRWYRATLELKCSGLSPGELARRSAGPSALSLLGIVRHLAESERAWSHRFAAEPASRLFGPDGADFDGALGDPGVVSRAWDAWRAEAAATDRLIDGAPSLDVVTTTAHPSIGPVSLRWALVHLIEEYARHLGHADLLRERVDGSTGE
jgi:uncharacterized damage-inducible protein DinB